MLKKISDAAPAALLGLASTLVLTDAIPSSMAIARIEQVINYPWSIVWLWALLFGALAIVVGVSFRSRKGKHGRLQEVGQGLEVGGYPLVGGALVTYAAVLMVQLTFATAGMSVLFMFSLASVFIGPWAVLLRDLYRAGHPKTPR
jgi:hypothetical protein